MAFHALRAGAMHPVRASTGCPLAPASLYKQAWTINGTEATAPAPCLLAAAFSSPPSSAGPGAGGEEDRSSPAPLWSAWAILNSCRQPVPTVISSLSLLSAGLGEQQQRAVSYHEITTYNISDPGGWSPLPPKPDELPWKTGPLSPRHVGGDGALPDVWSAPALSFSIVLLRG